MRETYGVEARRDDEDRKYQKTLQLKFADPETGLVMFDGNLLAAGREEDGFDSLEDAEREIGKLKVKENDEDAVTLLSLVLKWKRRMREIRVCGCRRPMWIGR